MRAAMNFAMTNSSRTQPPASNIEETSMRVETWARPHTRVSKVGAIRKVRPFQGAAAATGGLEADGWASGGHADGQARLQERAD
jgi:hypothetical protein